MGKQYSINDIEQLTGIKAHTIRIWEKRYDIVEPKRTPTNIRYYDESDMKRLLMISVLYQKGMRISEIAQLSDERIKELVLSFKVPHQAQTTTIEQLLIAVTDFNQNFIDEILVEQIIKNGIEQTYENLISPFLTKIRILWLTEVITTLHHDFAYNQVSRFLWQYLKVNPKQANKNCLIFAPTGSATEPHLIYITYLLTQRNIPALYFGQTAEAEEIVKNEKFRNCIFVSVFDRLHIDFYIELNKSNNKTILFCPDEISEITRKDNFIIVENFSGLLNHIR